MKNRNVTLATATLIGMGVVLAVFGREEISIICPFGGETPSVANYCLSHETYYLALQLIGLFSAIIGIGILVLGALSKVSKKAALTGQ